MRRLLAALGAGTVLLTTAVAAAPPPNALPATVGPHSASVGERTFPARGPGGAALPPQTWRVVAGTGNCCENYVATSTAGRLFDFGGGRLRFSDDAGSSWLQVQGLDVGGEGAVSEAPGGEVVGVGWDPYSGDRLEGVKLEADGRWYTVQNKLHAPFLDRPYVVVLPGPYDLAGTRVPYLTYLAGGWPARTSYWSLDGLNYVPTTSPFQPAGPAKSRYLSLQPDPHMDAMQPLTVPGVAPLPGGGALAWSPAQNGTVALSILDAPGTTWSPFSFPEQPPLRGRLLGDSAGRLHNAAVEGGAFSYRISRDGGRTWSTTQVPLPSGFQAVMPQFDRFWDFKANTAHEMAVVSMYARNTATGKDQNLVFVLSTFGGVPRLDKVLFAGNGDKVFGTGLGAADRLDFVTVGILRDGRVATTFRDAQFTAPVLGVTATSQSPASPPPTTSPTPTPAGATPTPSTGPTATPGPTPSPGSSSSPTPAPAESPTPEPTEPPDDEPPEVSAVSDRPDPFRPKPDGRRDRTRIRFSLSEDASVSVTIVRRRRVVRVLEEDWWLRAGRHVVAWGGRNDNGRRVAAGRYRYRIAAVDEVGNASEVATGTVTVRSG